MFVLYQHMKERHVNRPDSFPTAMLLYTVFCLFVLCITDLCCVCPTGDKAGQPVMVSDKHSFEC